MIELWSAAARIRAGMGKCLLLLSLGSLGACASFDARPEPVLNRATVVNLANADLAGTSNTGAIRNFYHREDSVRGGLTQKAYRNMIIGSYMRAADYQFGEFSRLLSRQSRGSAFGLDLGIIGFAGGASIAASQRTANILSAIASGLTGTRAALNRDVYFDRTLPALYAAMEASRTRIRTAIFVNMRRSAEDYPLPVALADLADYENAGSLDSAIQRVTGDAVQRADEAQQDYVRDVQNYRGPSEVGVADIKGVITTRLRTLETATGGRDSLAAAATALNVQVPAGATPQAIRFLIEDELDKVSTVQGARDFASKVGVPAGDLP